MTIERDQWPAVPFDDLIATTQFDVHERPHIVVDGTVCRDCSTRDCVVACPAKLFVPTADGGILFNYEQCFECGTCYLVCNREGRDLVVVSRGRVRSGVPALVIVACWKWAPAGSDDRTGGISPADEAALEVALRLAEASGDDVTVVGVGPPDAERGLRRALAAGAVRAVRVDAPCGLTSAAVAAAIAPVAAGARWVVGGDVSADRGTGAVPAFLAAELENAQALGLVGVELAEGGGVRAVRRLDGGRREVLAVTSPAVLSVEGSVARLRRASLTAELESRHAAIEVVPGPDGPVEEVHTVRPYRPRRRERPAPAGDSLGRIRDLTAIGSEPSAHAEIVTLDPPAAADRILAALRDWGYLAPDSQES